MKRFVVALAAAGLLAGLMGPAAAQLRPLTGGGGGNPYGDDRLSYRDGVVYDDDLVPGRGPNQPFLVEEQGSGQSRRSSGGAYGVTGEARQNSRQLIGPDGRLTTTTGGVRYTD